MKLKQIGLFLLGIVLVAIPNPMIAKADTKTVTIENIYNLGDTIPDSIEYNQDGYTGTLFKTGKPVGENFATGVGTFEKYRGDGYVQKIVVWNDVAKKWYSWSGDNQTGQDSVKMLIPDNYLLDKTYQSTYCELRYPSAYQDGGTDYIGHTFTGSDIGYINCKVDGIDRSVPFEGTMKIGSNFIPEITIDSNSAYSFSNGQLTQIDYGQFWTKSDDYIGIDSDPKRVINDKLHPYGTYNEQYDPRKSVRPISWLDAHPSDYGKDKVYILAGEYGNQTFHYTVDFSVPRQMKVTYTGTVSKGGGGGSIVFTPNSTTWTNTGKTSEGSGNYPITVAYTGTNPATSVGTESYSYTYDYISGYDKDGNAIWDTGTASGSVSFTVSYYLQSIAVSGDINTTVSGSSGSIGLTKEGANLNLSAVGAWGPPQYSIPGHPGWSTGTSIPDPPANPVGTSGYYNIDWTKPTFSVDKSAPNHWSNNPYPLTLNTTSGDNLSGFSNSTVQVTDSSHYSRSSSYSLPNSLLTAGKSFTLYDGLYTLKATLRDRAGNTTDYTDGLYMVDGIPPTQDFSETKIGFNRTPTSLTFNVNVGDNIEGLHELSTFGTSSNGISAITDNQSSSSRNVKFNNIPNPDVSYTFTINTGDLAGNEVTQSISTSVLREYWKYMKSVYGATVDTEVPPYFASISDTRFSTPDSNGVYVDGFRKSSTINYDTYKGIPVEIYYKFTGNTVNFIRIIKYTDPTIPLISKNGEPVAIKDHIINQPESLANKVGVDVGSNTELKSMGTYEEVQPIKTVVNDDGTITNYYINGDIRRINATTGELVQTTQGGYGEIINDLTEDLGNQVIYHTTNRFKITMTYYDSYTDMVITDRNNIQVEHTTIQH